MNDYRTENPLATATFFAVFVIAFLISFFINPYLFSSKPLVQKIQVSKDVKNSYLHTYTDFTSEEVETASHLFSPTAQSGVVSATTPTVEAYPNWNGHLAVQPSAGIYEKGHWFIGNNGVFFFSKDKGILEFKTFDGTLNWFFDSGSQVNFASYPLILKNQGFVSGEDKTLTSFNSSTGEILWTNSTEHVIAHLAQVKDELFAFSQLLDDRFIICAFKTKNGELNSCTNQIEGKILSVSSNGSTAYVTTAQGKILSFETLSQQPMWEFLANAAVKNAPVAIEQSLIITSESGQVVSLDKNSGAKAWEYQTTEPLRAHASLIPGYNLIMLMSKSGDLIALKRRTGEGKWRFKSYNQGSYGGSTIVKLSSKLMQSGGLSNFYGSWAIWTPCGNDRFCVYNPDSGQLVQRIYTHGPIASPPIFIDGQVYVAVENGTDIGSADKKTKEWAVVRLSPPPDPAAKAAAGATEAGGAAKPASSENK